MFAAIVSRALKSVSLWRLQEGGRIGLLDILLGSTTITNTITTQISNRSLNIVGIILVILWALSPVGGQASLRVLSFQAVPIVHSTTLQYMEMNSSYALYMSADIGSQLSPVDALFLSALAAPLTTKHSSLDNWGNLKIPMIETLPGYSAANEHSWIPVDAENVESPPIYSSLLGIPIANIPSQGNSSFNLETSYWVLNCPTLEKVSSNNEMLSLLNLSTNPPASDWVGTWGGINSSTPDTTPSGEFRCNGTDPEMPPRTIQYVSWDGVPTENDDFGTKAICTIQTTYVELSVSCDSWECAVREERQSTLPHPPAAYTGLDSCNGIVTMAAFNWYTASFSKIISGVHSSQPTAVQAYFINPEYPFNISAIYALPGLYGVGNQSFAISLGQMLNTYWIASVGTESLVLGHPVDFTGLSSLSADSTYFSYAASDVTINEEVLVCNRGWLIALIIATLAMFLAAVVKMFVDLKIWIPQLSMNVSTATRNNPAFAQPQGGSVLSDRARSRLLKDIKVRFGDLVPGEQVGQLAIGDCFEDGGHVTRFQKDRYYI